jgi:hypothetical protein
VATIAVRRRTEPEPERPRRRRATTPEGRERELISKAYDAIERRIENGEATGQELLYFAKAGSRRERLERMKIQHENELLEVKKEAYASQARTEELFNEAIAAFSRYSGQEPVRDA